MSRALHKAVVMRGSGDASDASPGRGWCDGATCAIAEWFRWFGLASIRMYALYVHLLRTTINLPDGLAEAAKRRATDEGLTFTSLVEEGLRTVLATQPEPDQARDLPAYGDPAAHFVVDPLIAWQFGRRSTPAERVDTPRRQRSGLRLPA